MHSHDGRYVRDGLCIGRWRSIEVLRDNIFRAIQTMAGNSICTNPTGAITSANKASAVDDCLYHGGETSQEELQDNSLDSLVNCLSEGSVYQALMLSLAQRCAATSTRDSQVHADRSSLPQKRYSSGRSLLRSSSSHDHNYQ